MREECFEHEYEYEHEYEVERSLPAWLVLVLVLVLVLGPTACSAAGGKPVSTPPHLTARHRAAAKELRAHVKMLAGDIGERNHGRPKALAAAVDYLARQLAASGPDFQRLPYPVGKKTAENLELTLPGTDRAEEIVVVGAHYDSVEGSPGANDNASGVAAALVLARELRAVKRRRTLRVVLFANEEPPYFQTDLMGSLVYARACQARGDRIVAMLSLETMGYYSDEPGSQHYPAPLGLMFPDRGNFVGFVANPDSRPLLDRVARSFRKHSDFPSEIAALSAILPGIGWSDHWSFWEADYPAVMVTDTAPFRYPHYHTHRDTPDRIDHDRLARVVVGLEGVIGDLLN